MAFMGQNLFSCCRFGFMGAETIGVLASLLRPRGFLHLLTAEKLSIFRGERLVLNGISLELGAGGFLLLRGANGAGKSTLLRALAGLTPLAAGKLCWDGAPVEYFSHAA